MKNIILFVLLLLSVQVLKAQEIDATAKLARHIAQKMSDTLDLNDEQQKLLVDINMGLSKRKARFFQKSAKKQDVERELQKIERTRDEQYEKVLTKEQYTLYLKKKGNLVSAN